MAMPVYNVIGLNIVENIVEYLKNQTVLRKNI